MSMPTKITAEQFKAALDWPEAEIHENLEYIQLGELYGILFRERIKPVWGYVILAPNTTHPDDPRPYLTAHFASNGTSIARVRDAMQLKIRGLHKVRMRKMVN